MNRRFRLLGYLTALKRLNRRMHNKSFTVDNQISVFGGRNIGDEYFDVNEKMNFADLDVVAIGSVVDDISQDFDRYWNCDASFPFEMIVTRQHLPVDLSQVNHKEYATVAQFYQEQISQCYFLDNLEQGLLDFTWVPVTFVSDPPTKALPEILLEQYPPPDTVVNDRLGDVPGNDESANLIHQIADTLLSPKHSLTIVSPYFVPSGEWAQRFVELAQRGITLNILTNSLTANDVLAVHAGYMRYRTTLLQGNVNLFELKSKRSLRHTALGMGSGSSLGSQFGSNLPATADANTGSDESRSTTSRPLKPVSRHRHKRPSRHYRRQHRDRHRWINRSTASLHAKTFSVDGEKLFIGSFNFDPRSAALNTEMGAIIHSPTLARELDDMIDRWKNELSYVVSINDDKLQWVDNSANPAAVFQDEPDSRFHQRLLVWLLGRLPIEDFL
jgi:putative cardiolipin synthase